VIRFGELNLIEKTGEYSMVNNKRPIFRSKAMQHYARSMEKDVLPRTATPPVFIFLWILLALLIAAAVIAWLGQVPVFVTGSGIIEPEQGSSNAVAVGFLPANYLSKVQAGQPVQLQIASTGQEMSGAIEHVEPGIISPAQARQQYNLGDASSLVVPGPSVAVTVKFNSSIQASTYAGSIVHVQAQIGTERILSLLPGLNALIGE
jgi:hypothetical protein